MIKARYLGANFGGEVRVIIMSYLGVNTAAASEYSQGTWDMG